MFPSLRAHLDEIVQLDDSEFEWMAQYFQPKKWRKRQFIVQHGDAVRYDHWVLEGLAKAYILDQKGKEYILQFAYEDWWVTDYKAYFNQTPAEMWIECLEPTSALCLSLENREKISQELHKMANFFRIKSNRGYVALQQRILSLLQDTAQERYDALFQKYPTLFQRVSKTQIAAYLGVSRETLSRLTTS